MFPRTLALQHLEEISVIGTPAELIVHFLFSRICLKKKCGMRSVPALSLEIHAQSTEKCPFITTLGFPVLNLTCSWQTLSPCFSTLKTPGAQGTLSLSPPSFPTLCPSSPKFGDLGARLRPLGMGESRGVATLP